MSLDNIILNIIDFLRTKTFVYYQMKNNEKCIYFNSDSYKEVLYDENINYKYGSNFEFETKYKDIIVIYYVAFNKATNWSSIKNKSNMYPDLIIINDKKNIIFEGFNNYNENIFSISIMSNLDTYGVVSIYLINKDDYNKINYLAKCDKEKFNKKGLIDTNFEISIFYHPNYCKDEDIKGIKYIYSSPGGITEKYRFRISNKITN